MRFLNPAGPPAFGFFIEDWRNGGCSIGGNVEGEKSGAASTQPAAKRHVKMIGTVLIIIGVMAMSWAWYTTGVGIGYTKGLTDAQKVFEAWQTAQNKRQNAGVEITGDGKSKQFCLRDALTETILSTGN